MKLRYATWAAVSTREQARADKFSIPNQLKRTQEEAEARGWLQAAGPFVVTGQSRTKYIQLDQAAAEIEPLRLMLQAARDQRFDVLIMTEFDRLRELLDQAFRTLASYGVQLYSLAQPFDPMPPEQYNIYQADTISMMIGMSQITSRLEISRTRRKWKENMPKRITELGLPVQIPFGYRKPIGHDYDRKAIPEPDPLIAPHIIKIKDMLLAGHSTSQLADYLNENNVLPPRSHIWHPQTIRDILRNPFYAGTVRFGASRVYLDPKTATRKRDRSIPPDQVQKNKGKHLPIWDVATRNAILLEFKRRTKNYRGRQNNQFTGLVKCGVCSSSMWRQGNGPRAYRLIWRCSTTPACNNNIPHTILIEKVAERLAEAVRVPEGTQRSAPKATAEYTAQTKLNDLRARQDRLEEAYLAGQWDLDRYTKRKAQLDGQIAEVQEEILAAEQRAIERSTWWQSLTALKEEKDIPTWLRAKDPNEINRALHILLQHIIVSAETIDLEFK